MLDFPWSRAVGRSKNSEVIAVINSRLFDDTDFAYISAKIWKVVDFPCPTVPTSLYRKVQKMLLDLDSSSLWYIQGCYMGYPSKSLLAFWRGHLVLKRIIKLKLFHWQRAKDILSRGVKRKKSRLFRFVYVLWNWLMSTRYILVKK